MHNKRGESSGYLDGQFLDGAGRHMYIFEIGLD